MNYVAGGCALLIAACTPAVTTLSVEPVTIVAPLTSQWVARVHYAQVDSSTACFFFSGPEDLGRETTLGAQATWRRDGVSVTLDFGEGVLFRGREGETVELTRDSTYEYSGIWTVRERIVGTMHGQTFDGEYSYEECDGRSECPGRCTIRARVMSSPPP